MTQRKENRAGVEVRFKVGLEEGHAQKDKIQRIGKRQEGKDQQKEPGVLESELVTRGPRLGSMSKNEDILNGNMIKGVVVEVRLAA